MARNNHIHSIHHLRVGDPVEVRGEIEIMRTLDGEGSLDALPFMPEMSKFCGHRFIVYKRADKVNDLVENSGLRRMKNAVILRDVRCDGESHGGCEAGCQILWKESWLRRATSDLPLDRPPREISPNFENTENNVSHVLHSRCTPQAIVRATRVSGDVAPFSEEEVQYRCQATEMKKASTYLHPWDVRQYVRDVLSGNVGFFEAIGSMSVWLFNTAQRTRGGVPYPFIEGKLTTTPRIVLDLKPGELVQVKSLEEIVQTLSGRNRNRGLWFDAEMVKYCGRRFRVLRRVQRIIDEKTGKMLVLPNECIVLDGVTCIGDYYRFYPQNEYLFWREAWLRKVDQST